MTTIVLVDSHQEPQSSLADDLKLINPQWTVLFAHDGRSALELIENQSVDCVITDSSLSDMNSFDLLSQIQSSYPEIVRITTSDSPGEEVVLENARANHRFLSKTSPASVFAAGIESSLHLRIVLQDEDLRLRIRGIKTLPALPEIYNEMLRELSTPHSSMLNVGRIIERDSALTATILKIVNSTFYGLSQRVDSVSQAVGLLGIHLIKNLALTASVFNVFSECTKKHHRLKALNDDAFTVGALANQFARYARVSRSTIDHSQIAGMLSNVGELIDLATPDLQDANTLSLPNEMLGAWLLRDWLMPDAVVEAIALQYETPPRHHKVISPLIILHVVRYLQENFYPVSSTEQHQRCHDYISEYVDADIALLWTDAYRDLNQLATQNDQAGSQVA